MALSAFEKSRNFCPHCEQHLASSTFKYHKRLYFNEVTESWIRSTQLESKFDTTSDSESEESSPPGPLDDLLMETEFPDSPPPSTLSEFTTENADQIDMNESEPESEIWDDSSSEFSDCPAFDPSTLLNSPPSHGHLISQWVLRFLMVIQASFKIPDIVLDHFLRFFAAVFSILSKTPQIVCDVYSNLPNTMYKAKKAIGVLEFTRFVVCKQCLALYTYSESVETNGSIKKSRLCSFCRFPSHPHKSMRLPCDTLLLKTVELATKKTFLYPFVTYCYLGLETSLQNLFNRPEFYTNCEKWRLRYTDGHNEESYVMRDVYDGKMWQQYINFKGEPFLAEPGNLGFILNFDFFQPFEHLTYSLGAIYLCVLNLPRESRYKQQNVILVGLIPGPHEPKRNINTFLSPLVNDLRKLWAGINFSIFSFKSLKLIRCALMCISCDIPAGRKICGFLGHGARLGCHKCYKEFQGSVGSMDYSGFDRNTWRIRTGDEHLSAGFRIKNLPTLSAIEHAESEFGCRYSELMLLPYFDGPKMLVLDPMHNLFLGSAKHFLKDILIAGNYISHCDIEIIQKRVNSFVVPAGIGRIPLKIESGFSKFTADQWKNFVMYYSIVALRGIISGEHIECWRHFVLACRVLCTKEITLEKAKLGDALLMQFCRRTERLFGRQVITPNMHLHSHLLECIMDYGPLHGFWCFAFERFNGVLGSMPNNNRSVEAQLMKRFLLESQVLSLQCDTDCNEFAPELLPLFPKKVQSGSFADTVSSYEPFNASSLCFSSIAMDCELPRFYHRHKISSFHQAKINEMYSAIYSVSLSDVDITETCVRYSSIKLKGRMFGCNKTRSAASSMVMVRTPSSIVEKAARIELILKHVVTINGETLVHLLTCISLFEPCVDPYLQSVGKPVSVWYANDTYVDFIPFQFIVSRAVTLIENCDGQSLLFVTPCIDF